MPQNAVQPATQSGGIAQLVEVTIGFNEGFLHRVPRRFLIAEKVPRGGVQPPLMPRDDRAIRIKVAPTHPSN